MAVRVRDLIDQTGKPGPHPVLHCDVCGEDYSANKGDYFLRAPGSILRCCKKQMRLVVKRVLYVNVVLPQEA